MHRSQPLWRKNPFSNTWWCLTVPVVWVSNTDSHLIYLEDSQERCPHESSCFDVCWRSFNWSYLILCPLHRLLGQVVQAVIDYHLWHDRNTQVFTLGHIPLMVWLLVSLSVVIVVLINEAVKLHEIRWDAKRLLYTKPVLFYMIKNVTMGQMFVDFRVRVRYQKRQKLQFETKLGMNSPFWSASAQWWWRQILNPLDSSQQSSSCHTSDGRGFISA